MKQINGLDDELAPDWNDIPTDSSISLFNVENPDFPVLVSVPHAGRVYPAEIRENLSVPIANLLRLEDRYADRLTTSSIASGFTTIIAQKPRAWIDLNRSKNDIDPDMVTGLLPKQLPSLSPKVRGGLGIIPRRLTGVGNLWREKWSWDNLVRRIDTCHEPYHRCIEQILEGMRVKFGGAILLDVHSMPPLEDNDNDGAAIVIGDRFGRSAGSRYSEIAVAFFEQSGFRTKLNHPYAGGYILERHSNPQNDIHAIQLEIDRSCYLDSELREPGAGLSRMEQQVERLAVQLANQINSQFQLAAAE